MQRTTLLKLFLLPVLFALVLPLFVSGCGKNTERKRVKVATVLNQNEVFLYLHDFKRHFPGIDVELEFLEDQDIIAALERPEHERPDLSGAFRRHRPSQETAGCSAFARSGFPSNRQLSTEGGKRPGMVGMRVSGTRFGREYEKYKEKFETPENYQDLLHDVFNRSIIALNPESSGAGYIFVSNLIQNMGEADAWAYLEKLDQNVKYYADDTATPARQTGRSNASVGITALTRCNAENANARASD